MRFLRRLLGMSAAEKRMAPEEADIVRRFALGETDLRDKAIAIHRKNIPLLGVRGSPEQRFMAEVDNPSPDVRLRARYRRELLKDRRDRLTKRVPLNTAYFDRAVVERVAGGAWIHFAFALNRRTGWPIVALWRRPLPDELTTDSDTAIIHALCRAPDERLVDVEGVHREEDVIELYGPNLPYPPVFRHQVNARPRSMLFFETYRDEAALWGSIRELEAPSRDMAPDDRQIALAERAIARSEPFLDLIAELSVSARGSRR